MTMKRTVDHLRTGRARLHRNNRGGPAPGQPDRCPAEERLGLDSLTVADKRRVLIWTAQAYCRMPETTAAIRGIECFFVFSMLALVIMRFGLLALVAGISIVDVLANLQPPISSLWYFGDVVFVLVAMIALSIWAFRVSTGGRRLLDSDLLG
jgi:hypothetical protein